MAKAFNKGQEVTYIHSWDDKGTFYFQHAIVYSCGRKQMVLTDALSGYEMGRHYFPEMGTASGTFPRMTDDEAIQKCLESAKAFLVEKKTRLESCIARNQDSKGYCMAMEKNLKSLHEPRALHHQR